VNPETKVASVGFAFPDGRSLEEGDLKNQVTLAGPGFRQRLQAVVDVLPLVPSPRYQSFDPPELLRDRTRLERYYRDQGFPEVAVDYEVTLDTVSNAVDIVYVVREGRPTILDSLVLVRGDGSGVEGGLPVGLRERWRDLTRQMGRNRGLRLTSALRIRLRDEVGNWFRDRGYPFPRVVGGVRGGAAAATLVLTVEPGPRVRVARREVEGNDILTPPVLLREVPLAVGDWFSESKAAEGERELMGLDMVRSASVRMAGEGGRDTLGVLRLRVDDGLPRLVSGQLGFTTLSGLSADASWSHRNFLGGARVLELSATARTGLLGPDANLARRYGLSLSLRQPYLFHRRLSGVIRPFVEYRNDVRDRSVAGGLESGLLLQRGPQRNLSLRYSLSYRNVLASRPGGAVGENQDLIELLATLDSLNLDRRTSSLRLTAQWGQSADFRGGAWSWDAQGSAEVAGPPGLSTVEYGRLEADGSVGRALQSWLHLTLRLGAGRVFPFGVSVPAPDGSDRLEVYLKLRDAILTAGGSGDVRGWGPELLGPKVPDLKAQHADGGSVGAGHYIPLGGLARWTGSAQLEVPFPLLGWPHGVHVFLDAGRVWTPDGRFLPTEGPLAPDQLGKTVRLGTGIGVSLATPVGPVQLDLGYKVNPSLLDTRRPAAVARALAAGESVVSVKEEPLRRWHLHFSIGRIR
jgi:outer membrane protein insertion porin family